MKEWILSICATGLITTVISIILPQGKLGGMIKGVLSLFVVLAIINPVVGFDFENFQFSTDGVFNSENTYNVQNGYLDYIDGEKIERIEDDCILIVKKLGVEADTRISHKKQGQELVVTSVQVIIKKWELNTDKEHKYIIEQVKNALSDYLKISKGDVVIYE